MLLEAGLALLGVTIAHVMDLTCREDGGKGAQWCRRVYPVIGVSSIIVLLLLTVVWAYSVAATASLA